MRLFSSYPTVGLNINDSSCELVVFDAARHPDRIIAASRTELPEGAIVRGVIVNTQQLLRALLSLKHQCGIQERATCKAVVSVSDAIAFPFSVPLEAVSGTLALSEKVDEAVAAIVPLPKDAREIFILQPIQETHAFGIAMNRHVVKDYRRVCEQAGFSIMGFECDHIAVARFVMPEVHKAKLFTLVDIGASVTHVTAVHDGYPFVSTSIPFGADQLITRLHAEIRAQCDRLRIDHVTEGVEQAALRASFQPFMKELRTILLHVRSFGKSLGLPTESLHVICSGGGSLLPHVLEHLQVTLHETVHSAHIGSVCDVTAIPEHELQLFVPAIGSAFLHRSTTSVCMMPLLGHHTNAKPQTVPLARFKNRTTWLVAVFIVLVLALIVLAILKFGKSASLTNTNAPVYVPTAQSTKQEDNSTLDIFGVAFSVGDGLAQSRVDISRTQKKDISTTGKREESDRAHGKVIIHNGTTTARPLVRLTRLQAESGAVFRIQSDVTVPAKGSVQVDVVADQPGADGNLPPGRLTIPGLASASQELIYAENKETFTGGIVTVAIVTESDITEATKQLETVLTDEITTALTDASTDTSLAIADSQIHFIATSDPAVDSTAASTTVSVTGTGRGIAFLKSAVDGRVHDRLGNATITKVTYSLSSYNPDTGKGVLCFISQTNVEKPTSEPTTTR